MKQKLSVMTLPIGGSSLLLFRWNLGVLELCSWFIRELFANYSWFVRDLFVRLNLRTRRTKREFREVCSPFSKITNVRSSFILLVRWTPYIPVTVLPRPFLSTFLHLLRILPTVIWSYGTSKFLVLHLLAHSFNFKIVPSF